MARYINAETIKYTQYVNGDITVSKDVIDKIPTADVQEAKHAHWEISSDGYYPYCSHCGNEPEGRVMTDFCPNCGAKMDIDR